MNGTHRRRRREIHQLNERCHRRQSVAMNGTHRRRRRELHQLVYKFGLACIVRNLGQFLEGGHLASARRGRRSACGCEGAHLQAQAQSGAIRRNQAQSGAIKDSQLMRASSPASSGAIRRNQAQSGAIKDSQLIRGSSPASSGAIRRNQAQSRTVSCNQGAHELLDDLVLRLLIAFVEEHRESFACQLLRALVCIC